MRLVLTLIVLSFVPGVMLSQAMTSLPGVESLVRVEYQQLK